MKFATLLGPFQASSTKICLQVGPSHYLKILSHGCVWSTNVRSLKKCNPPCIAHFWKAHFCQLEYLTIKSTNYYNIFWSQYCKLVETFHVASECKTAVYFILWLTLQFLGGQVIVTVNPLRLLYSLTDQDFILSKRDRTRPYKIFIITIAVLCVKMSCVRGP
jgi:hypothetical protein